MKRLQSCWWLIVVALIVPGCTSDTCPTVDSPAVGHEDGADAETLGDCGEEEEEKNPDAVHETSPLKTPGLETEKIQTEGDTGCGFCYMHVMMHCCNK